MRCAKSGLVREVETATAPQQARAQEIVGGASERSGFVMLVATYWFIQLAQITGLSRDKRRRFHKLKEVARPSCWEDALLQAQQQVNDCAEAWDEQPASRTRS